MKIKPILTATELTICKINFSTLSKPVNSGAMTPAENQAIDSPFKKSDKNFLCSKFNFVTLIK